jgi:hypothetical protein
MMELVLNGITDAPLFDVHAICWGGGAEGTVLFPPYPPEDEAVPGVGVKVLNAWGSLWT